MKAGTELFAERGFHASSMRELADRAGVSLSASYYHFPGKHDVLVAIMEAALGRLEEAGMDVMERPLDPRTRLAALVEAHIRVHLVEPNAARVADSELRALEPDARRKLVADRDRYEARFRKTLADGVAAGVFSRELDIPITAMAIITMGTATIDWWRPEGRLSIDEVAELYSRLAVAMAVQADTGSLREQLAGTNRLPAHRD